MRVALDGGPPNQICSQARQIRGGVWLDRAHLLVGTKGDGLETDLGRRLCNGGDHHSGGEYRSSVSRPGAEHLNRCCSPSNGQTAARMSEWRDWVRSTRKCWSRMHEARNLPTGMCVHDQPRRRIRCAVRSKRDDGLGPRCRCPSGRPAERTPALRRSKSPPTARWSTSRAQIAANHLAIVERSGTIRILGAPPDGYSVESASIRSTGGSW